MNTITIVTFAVGLAIGLASVVHVRIKGNREKLPTESRRVALFHQIRPRDWAVISILAFIGSALSLVNLWVATNLGNEDIAAGWRWKFLGSGAVCIICAILAISARR